MKPSNKHLRRALAVSVTLALGLTIGVSSVGYAVEDDPEPPISDTTVVDAPGIDTDATATNDGAEEPQADGAIELEQIPEDEVSGLPNEGTDLEPGVSSLGDAVTETNEEVVPDAQLSPLAAAAGGTINEREPNGKTSQAQSIPFGVTVKGKFGPNGDCFSGIDCDYYKVSAPSAGRLVLDLRFASTLGTENGLEVEVLNAVGERMYRVELKASDYDGVRLRDWFMPINSGVHYVLVKSIVTWVRPWAGQSYDLTPSFQSGNVQLYPNRTTATATPISLGTPIFGASQSNADPAYYRFKVAEASRVLIDFRSSCSLGAERSYRVEVLDNAGKVIAEKKMGGPECRGVPMIVSVPAGNAYVSVLNPWSPSALYGLRYSLSVAMMLSAATPTISGNAASGSTLTARPGSWGPAPVKFSYQWKRNGVAIPKATKSTYKVGGADLGRNITVTVTGSKSGYGQTSRTSKAKYVATTFTDVPLNQKFYKEIQWMYDSKRTTGIRSAGGLRYGPKEGVTREAMAAFLFRQEAKSGYKPPKKSPFIDVPTTHKFYKEIAWMYQSGLSTGNKVGNRKAYFPKDGVSREAMAAFLYRLKASKSTKSPAKSPFIDVYRNHKFYKEIAWMNTSGISTGTRTAGGKVYDPKATVSREAMAAFLYRLDRK